VFGLAKVEAAAHFREIGRLINPWRRSMSKTLLIAFSLVGFATLQSLALAPSAAAAILCKDGFQKSAGNWISTPYCNDAHLAQIARNHGMRVSDAEVRESPSKKDEVCRLLNGFPAARDYCPDDPGWSRGH
jgi:hypothetical protein